MKKFKYCSGKSDCTNCTKFKENEHIFDNNPNNPKDLKNSEDLKKRFESIETCFSVKALIVPNKRCEAFLNVLKDLRILFRKRGLNIKGVQRHDDNHSLILISPSFDTKEKLISEFKNQIEKIKKGGQKLTNRYKGAHKGEIKNANSLEKIMVETNSESVKLVDRVLKIRYSQMGQKEAMRKMLPEEVECPSSFETIGHIAHFNLRQEHYDHRYIIGKIVLDKNKGIRTVVNKKNTISSKFRNFELELVAGEADFITTVKENNSSFMMDIREVFWNSRLIHEHERVINKLKPGEILFDLFCGVGPFAIPAAKKGVFVYANDLNKTCCFYLKKNIKLNKISEERIKVYNNDAREFFRSTIIPFVSRQNSFKVLNFVMNLPETATDFLDLFSELRETHNLKKVKIKVFCHCFIRKPTIHPVSTLDLKEIAKQKSKEKLGPGIEIENWAVTFVRKVSPTKEMLCVEFEL